MKRTIIGILGSLALAGCGYIPTTTQHPAFAMNPADCAVLGAIVAPMLGFVPVASEATLFGTIVGKTLCQAESSIVAGPPATVTTTTQTVTAASTKSVP